MPSLRRAFTLIEIIVVMVLLGIMASLIVPRMAGNDKREFRAAVDHVGDLLTMYAQRQNLAQKVIGIQHERSQNHLMLVTLDTDVDSQSVANWYMDRYVLPVQLPRFMLDTDVTITMNGEIIDASEYPLSSEIGQERPRIEITLRGAGEVATVSLSPYGVSPTIVGSTFASGVFRDAYDLDTSGRSREDW